MAGLEGLYREVVLDHYRTPRNRGELESPPAHRGEGFNPLCGDEIVLYLQVDDDVVTDVAIGGQGCAISQASASMMTTAIKGQSVAEARRVFTAFKAILGLGDDDAGSPSADDAEPVALGDLEAMRGVAQYAERIKCATLAWNTLDESLNDLGHA
jgi:nitrogen fixation NifU-like protein